MTKEQMDRLAQYCQATSAKLMSLCDWYVVRETDRAMLGFKRSPTGQAKILAVAHVDFLRSGKVHTCNKKVIVSSALDDRAGVYMAFELLKVHGIDADILLTDAEECGKSTIKMLGMGMLKPYNWIVQLDRRGEDVVHYGYEEIADKLESVWGKKNVGYGAWSDIAYLQNVCPVSAFNIGVGYFNEHTEACSLSSKVVARQMARLSAFYEKYKDEKFERDHKAVEVAEGGYPTRHWVKYYPPAKVAAPAAVNTAHPKVAWFIDNSAWRECVGGCGKQYRGWELYFHEGSEDWCFNCRRAARLAKEGNPTLTQETDASATKEGHCEICDMWGELHHIEDFNWWLCDTCKEETFAPDNNLSQCEYCMEYSGVLHRYDIGGTNAMLCQECYKEELKWDAEGRDKALGFNKLEYGDGWD